MNDRPAAEAGSSPGEGGGKRDELCRLLRDARERRSMTIEDISRVTRIRSHWLRLLEAGEFEDLPGDVFVRGFLRSYARCVGLDAADVLRRYAECGMAPAPVASDHALAAAAEAAAMAERDEAVEVVGRAAPAGSGAVRGRKGSDTGAGTGSASASGSASGGTGTRAVTATGTGTGAQAVKGTATTGQGQARAGTGSRGTRSRQRRGTQGRAASQPAPRRVVPREVRGARSARGGKRRPSMLAVAIVVLVIAAIAVMSHLLRRPDERPRGGEAAGSSGR